MARLLPAGILLLAATTATQAQQIDSLANPAPDSLRAFRSQATSCPSITEISQQLLPLTTIQPALSRVAGVQVTPYSGAPGAWSTVRIRGVANVTGSSQPLYVVDGVPVYNTEITPERWSSMVDTSTPVNPSFTISTPYTPSANPLLDMPVEEVANIEIVKGAAATARYGIQGTNGVIVITTRSGADGKTTPQTPRVRYAGWGGIQQVRQRYELLNSRQYATLANEAAATNGLPAPFAPAGIDNLNDVNWQDQVLRVAGVQSHNLSMDGLANRTRYYVAADYLRQTGVVQQSDLSRYQLRVNLDRQLTPKLSVGLRASASQTDQHYAGTEPNAARLLQAALLAAPTDRDGIGSRPFITDPLRDLTYYASAPRTRRLLTQVVATYHFNDSLSLTAHLSREQSEGRMLEYAPDSYLLNPRPRVVEAATATTSVHSWVADVALHYRRAFAGRHRLAATATYLLQQFEQYQDKRYYGGAGPALATNYIYAGAKGRVVNSPSATFTYTYDGRYEVQGSLRSDFVVGSSGAQSSFQVSPGAQLEWHANKEKFLASALAISDLTLWAGAGQTSETYSNLNFFLTPSSLTPRTTHLDAGLRLGMFGGHLLAEATAYQRRTTQAQAAQRRLLANPGGASLTEVIYPNVTLLNQGVELQVTGTWQLGPLSGTSQLAAATNRNLVDDTNLMLSVGGPSQGLEKGQPLGRFFVYEQDGTYPAGSPNAGRVRFRDRNGDGQVDYRDGLFQGSGLPRYTLSFIQQFRMKRFQLEAQLDGLFGYQLLNSTLLTLDTPTGYTNSTVRALDHWTPQHQDTAVPLPGGPPVFLLSDQALANGDHLRLSQLTISYDVLPTGPRKISVWVGGQNLFVTGNYRGFDPNVSSGGAAPLYAGQDASVYPVARVWQVGVRGQF